MLYDANARTLHWRDDRGVSVAVKFSIRQRLRVSIQSPLKQFPAVKFIAPEEIAAHRMDSTAAARLGLEGQFSLNALKKAKREVALLYHPDRRSNMTDELKAILNRRMAEFNAAYAELKRDKDPRR